MQYFYFCLVFLSTMSVAILFEVKKIYVIERDIKTGQLRARRQNVPVQSHTVARIGGQLDRQLQQNMFNAAISPPPQQQSSGGLATTTTVGGQQQLQLQQPSDLVSTVDLTTDNRTPIDYLTPPPSNVDFVFQNFQSAATIDSTTVLQHQPPNSAAFQQTSAPQTTVQVVPLNSASAMHITSPPFVSVNGAGGFPSVQAQATPTSIVQTTSPSNQVHTLTFAGNSPPLEQFTPYTPTLAHESVSAQQQQQQQNGVGRWELGFDANDILTPPFAITPEQPAGGSGFGQAVFPQDFGQEVSSSVRNNKQYFNGGNSFDTAPTATNNKFTPLDAIIRSTPSSNNNNNNNVYWGTPKTAQQLPLRPPPPSFIDPNVLRFSNNNNNNHHHNHHHNNHHHHHSQFADVFQMPFTGQFDGPLSQGTVSDHVVHSSFRIKRQLRDSTKEPSTSPIKRNEAENDHDDYYHHSDEQKPVYSFVKTDKNGNFKWSVRQGYY